jgi:hypothetical protein
MKAVLTLAAAAALAAAGPLSAAAPDRSTLSAAIPKTPEVLRNVRAAVGQSHLEGFGEAFTIAEKGSDGRASRIQVGTRGGELRNGDEFLYDGRLGWQFDSRRKMFVPASLRQREKASWPLWIRGHWWLNPQSGLIARVLPEASSPREVAVALSCRAESWAPPSMSTASPGCPNASWSPMSADLSRSIIALIGW